MSDSVVVSMVVGSVDCYGRAYVVYETNMDSCSLNSVKTIQTVLAIKNKIEKEWKALYQTAHSSSYFCIFQGVILGSKLSDVCFKS